MSEAVATCPVAVLVREAVALQEAYGTNDERAVALKAGPEVVRLEHQNEHLCDRQNALEDLAAHTRARSLEGAMFQLLLVKDHAEAIASYQDERWAAEVRRHERQVAACLHSVLRLLEELSGTPAEAVGTGHYIRRDLDPHAVLEAVRVKVALAG